MCLSFDSWFSIDGFRFLTFDSWLSLAAQARAVIANRDARNGLVGV
jgi:hypothetical protein